MVVARAFAKRGNPVFCLFAAYKDSNNLSNMSSECLSFGGGRLENRGWELLKEVGSLTTCSEARWIDCLPWRTDSLSVFKSHVVQIQHRAVTWNFFLDLF